MKTYLLVSSCNRALLSLNMQQHNILLELLLRGSGTESPKNPCNFWSKKIMVYLLQFNWVSHQMWCKKLYKKNMFFYSIIFKMLTREWKTLSNSCKSSFTGFANFNTKVSYDYIDFFDPGRFYILLHFKKFMESESFDLLTFWK